MVKKYCTVNCKYYDVLTNKYFLLKPFHRMYELTNSNRLLDVFT